MVASSNLSQELEDGTADEKPLPFGQNLLGIEFLSDDWEQDIPLEWFEDEGKESPSGDGGCNG